MRRVCCANPNHFATEAEDRLDVANGNDKKGEALREKLPCS